MAEFGNILKLYEAHLLLERGLSENTRVAYLSDLERFTEWYGDGDPCEATVKDLETFVRELHDVGIAPRSQMRVISGLKSFYRFLNFDGRRDDNPMQLIDSPSTGRKLPEVLTIDEVFSNRHERYPRSAQPRHARGALWFRAACERAVYAGAAARNS